VFVGFYPYVALALDRCEEFNKKSFMDFFSNDSIWCRSLRITYFKIYFNAYLVLILYFYMGF
jgi:hypothetical protein